MKIFVTTGGWPAFVLRVTLGIVFFAHGSQKLLGWFGGNGFSGTMGYFTEAMGMPAWLAFLVIVTEFFGALLLLAGYLTRAAAFGTLCIMIGAIAMVHLPYGFFMNWQGQQAGEGYEFHLLVIAMSIALIFLGGGEASVDRMLAGRGRR